MSTVKNGIVKSQDKKEYLQEYKQNARKVQSLLMQIVELNICKDNLRSQKLSFTSSTTNSHKDISDVMVQLEQKQEELFDTRIELVQKNLAIQQCIASLEPDEKDLLYLRYVKGWSWTQIAEKLGYSESHVKGYIHGNALRNLKIPMSESDI